MAEGRVAEIMGQCDGFGQRFLQLERAGDGAGDLRDFDRVGHPRSVQIAFVVDEYLGLVGQATKGIAMNDAIALELAAIFRRRLSVPAAAGVPVMRGVGREAAVAHGAMSLARPKSKKKHKTQNDTEGGSSL